MKINVAKMNTVIGLLYTLLVQCEGYKVLLIFPIPTPSHANLGDGFARHLLKAGHELTNVTLITSFPKENTNAKLRQISVADHVEAVKGGVNVDLYINQKSALDQRVAFNLTTILFEATLRNPAVQNLLNDPAENFDVVITELVYSELYCGIAAVFNCPYIWFLPYELDSIALRLIDEAINPAYIGNVQFNEVPPFDFRQRALSLWFQIMYQIKYKLFYEGYENTLYESYFTPLVAKRGRSLAPYRELKYNASLMFGSSHVSFGQAIRQPQNYVSIAGHHVDDVKPLPEDLQKIMNDADNGVIFFSLGSNLKSKDLPVAVIEKLLKVFGELKHTVIWKFEEELLNLPKNVHILKWAPQLSILDHPNCILFITQGGLLSTIEAVHFGVPFIGIPAFYDQFVNVYQAVKKGAALKILFTDNLANDLKEAIHEIIDNPTYRQKMKEVSFVYHHRPASPGKQIVHWVEHVVQTAGAPHLRSPALSLPWYQKMFLDLIALILVVFISIIYLIKLIVKSQTVLGDKKKLS